jgi:hypothetical protein
MLVKTYGSALYGINAITITVEVNIDTTPIPVGTIVYANNSAHATAAISTSLTTGAEMIVSSVGIEADGTGRAVMSGFFEGALVEAGPAISIGDLLYLSNSQAGTLTNVQTSPLSQVVGRALSAGNSANPIDIIFFPRAVLETSGSSRVTDILDNSVSVESISRSASL